MNTRERITSLILNTGGSIEVAAGILAIVDEDRNTRAIGALRRCVEALKQVYTHADRSEDEETILDALADARDVLGEEVKR